jgi:hypothetical protein
MTWKPEKPGQIFNLKPLNMKKTLAVLSTILIATGLKAQNSPAVKKETLPQGINTQDSVGIRYDTSKLTNRNDKITARFDKLTNSSLKNTNRPDKITKVIKGDEPLPDSVTKAIKITNNAQQLKKTQNNKPFKF